MIQMHTLSYEYHWDRDTVWKLRRSERRAWYDLIRRQRKAENESNK